MDIWETGCNRHWQNHYRNIIQWFRHLWHGTEPENRLASILQNKIIKKNKLGWPWIIAGAGSLAQLTQSLKLLLGGQRGPPLGEWTTTGRVLPCQWGRGEAVSDRWLNDKEDDSAAEDASPADPSCFILLCFLCPGCPWQAKVTPSEH